MSHDLTDRQQAVLDFIRQHIVEEGLPPKLKKIAEAFGFRQPCAALKHVRRLEELGHLRVLPNQVHGIRLTGTNSRITSDQMRLPILGRVAAGAPIGANAEIEKYLLLDRNLFSLKPDYLLRVKGDSMRDEGILDGDLVAIRRASNAMNHQIVVARIDGEITIKRLEQTAKRIRLLPRNPDYDPIVVKREMDFAIEGLYCGLVRTT